MRSRGGFTLIELLIGLTLGLMVGGLVSRQLLVSRRLVRAQTERVAMQENVRVAALVLAGELGGIGYDEVTPSAAAVLGLPVAVRSDLLAIAPGAVTYLAGRGSGHVCAVVPGPLSTIVVEQSSWASLRAPRATDSLLVFVEGDPASGADDAWIHLGVLSAAGTACPDGAPATEIRIGVPAPLGLGALAGITRGSPVRLVEVMQLRYYASGGQSWFGLRSVSAGEAITPVAGPLADSTGGVRGLTLRYRDAADGVTSDPAAVRTIEIALLGVTDQPIHGPDARLAQVDTFALTLRVAPRNVPRP